MDYEKAYKAALETATKWIKDGCIDKEKICLECVFPELAESEDERDERIRKAIVHLLTVASESYLIDATGFKKEQFLSWLEKQKESLHISEMCKENGESFTREQKVGGDTDTYFEDLRMTTKPLTSREWFEEGMKYAQRLQKEQKPVEKSINWTELTWKDIVELEEIINNVHYEFRNGIGQESFGEEVLEKFREYKGDEYLDEMGQQPAEYIKRNSKEWYALLSEQYDKGYWKGKAEQKPAEWSEEDERMLGVISYKISQHQGNDERSLFTPDEAMFIDEIEQKLKSLRPQPQWKPSEEQMRVLKQVEDRVAMKDGYWEQVLDSLYLDLQKL